MTFEELKLSPQLVQAVSELGYKEPTPIQQKAIPFALEGRDVLGCAQTGTGKTAAYALPILHRLDASKKPGTRVLVLAPTRELAAQIDESFRDYGKHMRFRTAVIFGGVSQGPQTDALKAGVEILVATPGRLLDLMEQGYVKLDNIEYLVLDEADRMLDMGFILDIRRIVARVPAKRQTLFFSATMPSEIRRLADTILKEPVIVEAAPPATTVAAITQSVYYVGTREKAVLLAHLLSTLQFSRVLVFVATKVGADRVVSQLRRWGIDCDAIHGDKTQGARTRVLENFKSQKTRVLIATDVAARGLDIDDVSHVINYDMPHEAETYVHRIGRTGRAGASGEAISFCAAEDFGTLADVERLVRGKLIVRKADSPEYAARLRDPSGGAAPLPQLEGAADRVQHAHASRGARGQRARGPRHEPRQEREPEQDPRDHVHDRDSAYENASDEYFKPQRKNKKPQAAPVTHAHVLTPATPHVHGRPRRSQG